MVGDNIGYFGEGDLVFIGTKVPHLWINDPEYINGKVRNSAQAIVIHFLEDFLGRNFFDIPEMSSLRTFLTLSQHGLAIQGVTRLRIASIMNKMLTMNGIQRLSALFTIFDLLCSTSEYELLASPGYLDAGQTDTSDRFSKLNSYIMKNFDKDIKLKEAASIANMALSTFCIFFKAHYRVTFVEYLNIIRIGHACRYLNELDKNVVEIAYQCGFNNLANFNRQFKKIKKMTPSEYRRTTNVNVPQTGSLGRAFVG